MVGMKDYEGYAGFQGGFGSGAEGPTDVENLNKALSAGSQSPRSDGGSALRAESLESTLRILTFSQQHVKLWKDIPKLPAYSTSEEYTIQTAYGGETGVFTREGELPQAQDAAYERRVALVKFLGTQREVSHVMTLVKPAHGNVIALETQNGAIWIMERLERALFAGRSDTVPESFDGIDKQITDDPVAAVNNVIDLRGGIVTEDQMELATNIVVENYGVPEDFYLAPRALSDMAKQFFPKERVTLGSGPTGGRVGLAVTEVMTQAGLIGLKSDIFLRSGKNNGVKKAPASATAVRAPTAPTVSAAVTTPTTGSLFVAADAGTYQYKVTSFNRFGESGAAQLGGGAAILATSGVALTITDGGGSDTATGYRIYRGTSGSAAGTEKIIAEIPRIGTAATTVFTDLNTTLPNTSRAYLLQMNLQSLSFRQLAPMMKIPLATLAASIRWMQLLYGTPIVYAPRKNVVFTNVQDD